ncbi:hypothetical protein SLA2020_234420 [Shorea laevis]
MGRSAWIPPPSGIFKFNFDASYSSSSGVVSSVVVGRNSNGFICTGQVQWRRALSSLMVEAVALLMVAQLAIHMQVQKFIFESDCKVQIECVNDVTK